jgi:outer membrane biosynthesis protein TonB
MYFDFEDNHPDISPLEHPITWREVVLLTIILHLLMVILVILHPELPGAAAARARAVEQMQMAREQAREAQRFVFVQPRLDTPAPEPPKPRAPLSDKDRVARTLERAPAPTSLEPYSRGNTPERVEGEAPRPAAPPAPAAPPGVDGHGRDQPEGTKGGSPPLPSQGSLLLPSMPETGRGAGARGAGAGQGLLGSALRDLQRYVREDAFDNQGGGGAFGPSIQFDTKGVEFGPWIRRFIAQIKRNWFIPYAAMAMKGHVVVTFYVMKDGRIGELAVPGPCPVEAFNNAAFNALAASNPTQPLPPEYPSDRAFFTVTFYYNETPPSGDR